MLILLVACLSLTEAHASVKPAAADQSDHPQSLNLPVVRLMDAVFTAQTGEDNPLNATIGVSETFSKPTFVDLDGDGDYDAVIGYDSGGVGLIKYYENQGTNATPDFAEQTGGDNPFSGISDAQGKIAPTFVNLDGDGDQDLVFGNNVGALAYYENDAGTFTLQTGADSPIDGIGIGGRVVPLFIDIDNDSDLDLLLGTSGGKIRTWENDGGAFSELLAGDNPFAAVDVSGSGSLAAPVRARLSGAVHVIVGTGDGSLFAFTTGGSPLTDQDNPVEGVSAPSNAGPAFVDLDADGDQDLFLGTQSGDVLFFENEDPFLPVTLTRFEALVDGASVRLSWATASETNNAGFHVQTLTRQGYQSLGFVPGQGTTSEPRAYAFEVPATAAGTHRYRLKQVDFDGGFGYSEALVATVALVGTHQMSGLWPNPFNPQASFTLSVAREQAVRIAVYDVQGRQMALVHEGVLGSEQAHRFTLEGARWASGKYLVRAEGETFTTSRLVTLIK